MIYDVGEHKHIHDVNERMKHSVIDGCKLYLWESTSHIDVLGNLKKTEKKPDSNNKKTTH